MGAVEQVYEVSILLDNPTVAQIKNQREKKQRTSKAKAVLFAAVSPTIFYRIMTLKTSKEIWNFLKGEYKGNERIKGMQVLNLIREFELQKMKESETIKEYSNKLLSIVNNIKLLGTDFSNSRIVQKILVTILEKFETTISSLENSKDLSSITLAELLNALQAQEQRRLMRQERTVEGAFFVKSQNNRDGKNRKTSLEALHSTPETIRPAILKAFLPALTTKKKTIILRINAGGDLMHVILSVVS
jgi:hypothetical protein